MGDIETLVDAGRKCLDCGTPLGAGREDRKYCDENCKTNYNNRVRREKNKPNGETNNPELSVPDYIKRIQDIQLKNREILKTLCDDEKPGRIRMRDLIGKGFNLKFFTSEAEPTETGNVYRFCFEYGYRENEDGTVVIVCRPREVN